MQNILESLTLAQGNYAGSYMGILRYAVPILSAILLLRCVLPLLTFRREPEIWAWLCLPGDQKLPLTHWENVVGRSKRSDVVVDFPTVSRNHCVFTRYDDGSWTVSDAASKDGVYVNGKRVSICALEPEDTITIGGIDMTLLPISARQEARLSELRTPAASPASGMANLLILTAFQLCCMMAFLLSGTSQPSEVFWGFAGLTMAEWVLFIFYLLEHFARRGHRAAAWCELALIAALLLGFSLFTVLETMVVRGSFADESDAPVSAVIVLGAGVNGETPSLSLRTRIDAAAAYLARHPDVPVILSGGQGPGEAITEAECMRRALVSRGVDEDRLHLEERSASTEENLRFSREMLEGLGVDLTQRVAIVTSDYHLCRARLMWGGASTAVPAHMPSALYFRCLSVNYFIREAFGLAAYFVYGG